MERRNFLGALTGASLGILLEGSLTQVRTCSKRRTGWHKLSGQAPFEDFSSRGFRKHDFRAPLRKRASHSDGARLPAHKPDVAIPRAEACRKSHRDLRRPARLRPQRDTRFYRRPLSLFKARNGGGTGWR
jgi:hypothetical protein